MQLLILEALLYLVFKVQWCRPRENIAFQPLGCQVMTEKKSFKSSHSKLFGDAADLMLLTTRVKPSQGNGLSQYF
ncbi:MAG: hypothetical protein C6Y22_03180 [Hapalosiphonaceae cyanobacterium JJU2]|nr:MAG: hypothetical protein C6Y22_03180 [Hapalosiphonaceae cyanobacterium JJU2]